MPSPLVPVQYRSPAHETNYQTAAVPFTATCPACGLDCRWVATGNGSTPDCPCLEGEAA